MLVELFRFDRVSASIIRGPFKYAAYLSIILYTLMNISNVAMLFSVIQMSGKECNDFKLIKTGDKVNQREAMITLNILWLFLVDLNPTFPLCL